MQNHQFDLRVGDSVRLGDYKITLLEIDGDGEVVLEIDGPDGNIRLEPEMLNAADLAEEPALMA